MRKYKWSSNGMEKDNEGIWVLLSDAEEYASQFKKELNVPTDEEIEHRYTNSYIPVIPIDACFWMRNEIIKRNK